MRVTKVIKDYIEEEVGNKFDPLIRQAEKEYSDEVTPTIEAARKVAEKANEDVKSILKNAGFEVNDDRTYISYSTFSTAIHREKYDAKTKRVNELRAKKREAINNIVLLLELGEATKNELKDILAAVVAE